MLKRDITFETLEDPPRTITQTYYFNLTMPEFASLNPDVDINEEDPDPTKLLEFVAKADDLVLLAYGVKADDGMGFEKSDELRKAFKKSLAYTALVDELFTDDKALNIFIAGVLPKKLAEGLQKITSMQELGASTEEIKAEILQAPKPPVPPTS